MKMKLADIARTVGGRVAGDGEIWITGVAGIKEAVNGDLTFLANSKYLALAVSTGASALIVGPDVLIEGKAVIQTVNPSLAFAQAMDVVLQQIVPRLRGIHPTAVIDPSVIIGEEAAIGPLAVIEPDVKIGKNTIISAGVFIGRGACIGDNCLIYPNVTVRELVLIHDRVIIHSGTVVGSDGFGYAQVDGRHIKIPQMGTVVIEDDVEIGACVTIDRARFDKTLIGSGTKIDNLVQIAHNVHVGRNVLIIALAGIAGSSEIGDGAIVAGQAGVAGHTKIGAGAVIAAQSGITKNVPAGAKMFGCPAEEYGVVTRIMAHTKRLPRYAEEIKELKAQVAALSERLGQLS